MVRTDLKAFPIEVSIQDKTIEEEISVDVQEDTIDVALDEEMINAEI